MIPRRLYSLTERSGTRVRYWVFHHDGVQTHKDGSAFYAVTTFTTRMATDRYIYQLQREGYTERSYTDQAYENEGPTIQGDMTK